MLLKNSLLSNTFLYMLGEVIPRLIAFVLLPIYTNYLSPFDYGVISYTNAVVMFLFFISVLSMNSYALRFYFEYKTESERKCLLGNVFIFIAFVNILTLLVCWLLGPSLINKYNIQVAWDPYMKLAIISNFLEVFSVIPLVLYRVHQNAKMFVLLNLSRVLFQFILTYILIVILKWGVAGHFYGRLLPLVFFFFIYFFIMLRNTTLNINIKQIVVGLKYALPLLPGAISYYALSFSDRVILERNVDLAAIGVYNIAYTLSFALTVVNQGVYKAIEPEVFNKWGKSYFQDFMDKSQSIFYLILYSGALALALFSQEIFILMASNNYEFGYRLVPVIVVGVIMTGQNVIFNTLLSAEKNTKAVGFSTLIGACVSLIFNLIFVPIYGVWAASIATAISFFIMNILMFNFVKYKAKRILSGLIALVIYLITIGFTIYILDMQFSLINIFIKLFILSVVVYIYHTFVFKTNKYLKLSARNV